MPTFPYDMNDEKASYLIRHAFPKGLRKLQKPFTHIQIHDLNDALLYARTKCAHEQLGFCIQWAYEVNGEKYKI